MLLVKISRMDTQTQKVKQGKLVLCDLAGSERLKKSLSTEQRMKEAIEINKSLTALGDVINAVTENAKFIPFKHHKLTEILADALAGQSKALMFVNCSPASSNFDETMMSLNFATRAKKISDLVTQRFLRVNSVTAGGDAFEHIETLRKQYEEAEAVTTTAIVAPAAADSASADVVASRNSLDSDNGSGEGKPESEDEVPAATDSASPQPRQQRQENIPIKGEQQDELEALDMQDEAPPKSIRRILSDGADEDAICLDASSAGALDLLVVESCDEETPSASPGASDPITSASAKKLQAKKKGSPKRKAAAKRKTEGNNV